LWRCCCCTDNRYWFSSTCPLHLLIKRTNKSFRTCVYIIQKKSDSFRARIQHRKINRKEQRGKRKKNIFVSKPFGKSFFFILVYYVIDFIHKVFLSIFVHKYKVNIFIQVKVHGVDRRILFTQLTVCYLFI
jgi:hypothetical protein